MLSIAKKAAKAAADKARRAAAKQAAEAAKKKAAAKGKAEVKTATKPPKVAAGGAGKGGGGKEVSPKRQAQIDAEKKLTKRNVKEPAERKSNLSSQAKEYAPRIERLQKLKDAMQSNKKKDLAPTQTKAEAGASAKRTGSDFTRQEQIGMQKSLDRQMGELEWYKKNQPDNNEQIAIVSREIAKLKKRGFLKVEDSYAPKKPAIEGATAAGAKSKPKAKPFTGSKRGAFNNAKDKGAKTFAFDGQTFDTSAVAKQFADADKRAGLNRGGAVKRAMGSADFRKGGTVLSTIDNRRNK